MNFTTLVNWFIHPDYHGDALALRKARLLVRACLLTSLFSISYVWLSVIFSYEKGFYFTAFNVIGYFILPFFVRTKISLRILGNLYSAIGAITVLTLTWYSGGIWSAIYPWIIAIPVLSLLIVGRTTAIYWSVVCFFIMEFFGVLELKGIKLPVEYNVEMRSLWFISIVPGLLLIIMVVSFTFEYAMQQAMADVEAQKKTIEKQASSLERLIEEKDHIIRILAHDLKNPLANIGILTKLLQKEITSEEPKNLVEMIGQASSNAGILVKQVLEMATLEHRDGGLKLTPTNIQEVVHDVVNSFKQIAESKEIKIKTKDLEKYYMVMADLTYLRSVLENLISNAIKFSSTDKEILLSVAEVDQQVQLRVRDHGPGVPVEEENRLFKKFSRLSARPTAGESSSGLGLSLVKGYMELMNGRVWHERPEGGGSIFAIELVKA